MPSDQSEVIPAEGMSELTWLEHILKGVSIQIWLRIRQGVYMYSCTKTGTNKAQELKKQAISALRKIGHDQAEEPGVIVHWACLSYSPSQVPITCGDYIALVLPYSVTDAIICVCAFVGTRQPLQSGILNEQKQALTSSLPGKSILFGPMHLFGCANP